MKKIISFVKFPPWEIETHVYTCVYKQIDVHLGMGVYGSHMQLHMFVNLLVLHP